MPVSALPEPVARVAAYLDASGGEARIEQLAADCATAEGAADAVGCTLGQIVKILVLVCDETPVAALVPGDLQIDASAVARELGAAPPRPATPEEVVAATGFAAGAVAPFPLARVRHVLLDTRLLANRIVWAGAGSAHHLLAVAPRELMRLARAEARAIAGRRA